MDLKLLQVFKAVYEAGSYSKAADYMGMTQPAISNAIKRLDNELSYKCFIRQGRGITPTDNANSLYKKISHHIDAIENAVVAKSNLVIYATENILLLLTDIPNIKLIEAPASEEQVYNDLRSGKVDIAIYCFSVKENVFTYQHIFKEEIMCVHKSKQSVTLDEYIGGAHAVTNIKRIGQPLSNLLGGIKSREIKYIVSGASNTLLTVANSDCFALVLSSMIPFATKIGLNVFTPPFPVPALDFELIHHKRSDSDQLFNGVIENIKDKLKQQTLSKLNSG